MQAASTTMTRECIEMIYFYILFSCDRGELNKSYYVGFLIIFFLKKINNKYKS